MHRYMKKTHSQRKVIASLVIFLFLISFAHSATITSTTAGGNWATGSTWVGGAVPKTNDAVVIATTSTGAVQISDNLTQTAAGSVTVNNGALLSVTSGRGTITFGTLAINNGGTFTMYRRLIVLGATNISGTINFGSTSSTVRNMTFTGAVTLNSGAVWNETTTGAAATFTISNNFTNNATTFTAQPALHTFSGTGTLNGSTNTSIPNVTFTANYINAGILIVSSALTVTGAGIYLTNNGSVTATTALSGTGGFNNGATGILNIGGTSGITTLIANTAGNSVNYSGAGQIAKATTYFNLNLSGSGTKTFATTPTVNGTLSLEGTASVVVSSGVVTYGAAASLQYNKSAAYSATTEEWITPFTATGGITVTNTGIITLPFARTIGNASSLNLKNGILAAGINLTMASNSTINRSEGSMTGTLQGTGIYNVIYTGNTKSTGTELSGSGLYNVTVNLATANTTLTSASAASAFTVNNSLTVSQGNLILASTDANYTVTNDLIVSANGTLTHSVNWDITGKLLRVNGSISIDGKFLYTVRSHVQMGGANKTIRTGPAPSALSILTLVNTSGTISASGLVTVDDNFWASFNTIGGTFATSGNTVYAKGALLINGGTLNINGGTMNVVAGVNSGFQNLSGYVTLSAGTLNSDFINIGDGIRAGTFSQTGGAVNVTGNLLINPSCSYTCTNSPVINIGGNLVNNGTYTKATETVAFTGTIPSSISGSSNTILNNLTIANTGGVTMQLGILTTNNLTIASGKFIIDPQKFVMVNGKLTLTDSIVLRSISGGTASLVTKGTISGSKARVERYIGGASWAWHYLSSPVTSQAISGDFTPSGSGNDYDFYYWYEPQLLWVNFKNTTINPTWNSVNGGINFNPGRGYIVAYQLANTTKNFIGQLNTGQITYTLTHGGGATHQYTNLVGNPYPCSIDWDATSGWDRSLLEDSQPTYWIWNDDAHNFGAYTQGGYGLGTNGATNYISSGQGFMVLAASAGELTMNDGVKAYSTQSYLKSEKIRNDALKLKLNCDANTYSDEAIVAFNNSVSDGGADKFSSMYTDAPELWSVKNGENYSINFMGDISSADIVPLTVKAGAAGMYTLTASQVESFAGNSSVTLEDRSTGTFTFLGTTPTYSFQVNAPATITDRFFLHFMDITGIANPDATRNFNMYTVDGVLNIQSLQQLGGKVAVIDMQGRTIATGRVEAGATTRINMNGKTGVYIVSILTGKGINNTKILVK